ncbi:MAG: hypothetical protein Q7J73_08165, partial [Dehalococcoidales bacterium]|nr:hypothetical protein [Dehalococcoidales bacterium]
MTWSQCGRNACNPSAPPNCNYNNLYVYAECNLFCYGGVLDNTCVGQANGCAPTTIGGAVFVDSNKNGVKDSGEANYNDDITISANYSPIPYYPPGYCSAYGSGDFTAPGVYGGSPYQTCITDQTTPSEGNNGNVKSPQDAANYCGACLAPGQSAPAAQYCTSQYNQCANSCNNNAFFAEYFGGVLGCLGACQTLYCAAAPAPQRPAPKYKISTPGKTGSYSITAQNASDDLAPGTYTVNYSNLPAGFSRTEPASGSSFNAIVGPHCSPGTSKNASCFGGSVNNLNFGISSNTDVTIAYKGGNASPYVPDSTATFTYTVKNNSTTATTTAIGFWPRGATGPNPLANCPISGGNAPNSPPAQTVTLGPGESKDVSFAFNVGATGATAYAYASYSCSPADGNWANNSAAQTYVVNTNAWFETTGGDVGSSGSISVKQTPPAGKYQSSYLLAG